MNLAFMILYSLYYELLQFRLDEKVVSYDAIKDKTTINRKENRKTRRVG